MGRVMGERRMIGIEALLRWAYRDELPKHGAPVSLAPSRAGWDAVSAFGELMPETVHDGVNRFGVVPFDIDAGRVHPDAEIVAASVRALDELVVALGEEWAPVQDVPWLLEEMPWLRPAVSRSLFLSSGKLRRSVARLVERHAIMGGSPEWAMDEPKRRFVMSGNGRMRWFRRIVVEGSDGPNEIEVDGYDSRRKVPYADAYRKSYLDPDPVPALIGRAEYGFWWQALAFLCGQLNGRLSEHAVEMTALPPQPWVASSSGAIVVLADLRPPPIEVVHKRPRHRATGA